MWEHFYGIGGLVSGVIGLVVGTIGVVLTIRYRKTKRPMYAIDVFEFDTFAHPNMHWRFKNRKVDKILIARISFWNAGRQTIDRSDIPVSVKGPHIEMADGLNVLDHAIYASNGDSSASLEETQDQKELKLDFELLDQNEYLFVELICEQTEPSNTKWPVDISGKIKGSKIMKGETDPNAEANARLVPFMASISLAAASMFAYPQFLNTFPKASPTLVGAATIALVSFFLFMVWIVTDALDSRKRTPKSNVRFLKTGLLPGSSKTIWTQR